MNCGSKQSQLEPTEAIDRLSAVMAGGNFEITQKEAGRINFRHGTYLTQTATMLPKEGFVIATPRKEGGSLVGYQIEVSGFAKYWMMFISILFCWLIFPPILVRRALKHHPDQLMKNLLNAI